MFSKARITICTDSRRLLKWLFFSRSSHCCNHVMINIFWLQIAAHLLQIPQKYQLVHALALSSFKLFSLLSNISWIVSCYEVQLNRLFKETERQLP